MCEVKNAPGTAASTSAQAASIGSVHDSENRGVTA